MGSGRRLALAVDESRGGCYSRGMAQPPRVERPGGLYHVMSRGNERRSIVRDDADRQRRLDGLRRTVDTCGWRLHAFVLMTNHEHLFLETPEGTFSAGMHLLNSSYTGVFQPPPPPGEPPLSRPLQGAPDRGRGLFHGNQPLPSPESRACQDGGVRSSGGGAVTRATGARARRWHG